MTLICTLNLTETTKRGIFPVASAISLRQTHVTVSTPPTESKYVLQFDSVIHVNNGPSNPFSGFKGLKILIYLHLITSYVSYFH